MFEMLFVILSVRVRLQMSATTSQLLNNKIARPTQAHNKHNKASGRFVS